VQLLSCQVRCIYNASCDKLGILRKLFRWVFCAESIPELIESARGQEAAPPSMATVTLIVYGHVEGKRG
jgi:hypothetical protein